MWNFKIPRTPLHSQVTDVLRKEIAKRWDGLGTESSMLFLMASYGRGVRENVGGVVRSAPIRIAGEGVTMRG